MLKKIIIHFLVNMLIISAMIGAYIVLPESYQSLDNRLRDFMFISRGKQLDSGSIRIVSIDEASLTELGQWPWERNKIATMLDNLTAAGALVIGMDVFFSEQDKSSPQNIIKSLNIPEIDFSQLALPDYDEILANSFGNTPTVLGYIFDLNHVRNTDSFPMINTVISENNFAGTDFLPVSKGVTLNLDKFQDKAISSGFLNNIPDESGMIRRVPLLIKYQEIVFTSLALEVYRLVTGTEEIKVNYHPTGISSIELINQGESTVIPTDRYGRLFLNFLGPKNGFTYISAKDVISDQFDHKLVKDKIVLFGATSVGLLDLRAIPFDNAYPGIEVHATAVENMLKANYLQSPDWTEGANIILLILIGIILTIIYSMVSTSLTIPLMALMIYLLYVFMDYLLFSQGIIINILFPLMSIIIVTISSTLVSYFFVNRQRKFIKDKFARKVSSAVVDDILKKESDDMLIAQEREVSIFFSDVRSFTNISETLGSPKKLIDLMNIYMTPMVDDIMNKHGTIDKFIGDAVMAYWNAPHNVENHADQSVKSALSQLNLLNEVNQLIKNKYGLEIDIGIGINTGIATVGEMGSSGRSDYTIIGDAVNLASRIEGLNKPYGTRLIVSEFTLSQLKDTYIVRELDKVRVKGKKEGIAIYEVMGEGEPEGTLVETLKDYNEALSYYFEGKFIEARPIFESLLAQEEHVLYKMYVERCTQYIENPPENFDGVYTFTTK